MDILYKTYMKMDNYIELNKSLLSFSAIGFRYSMTPIYNTLRFKIKENI